MTYPVAAFRENFFDHNPEGDILSADGTVDKTRTAMADILLSAGEKRQSGWPIRSYLNNHARNYLGDSPGLGREEVILRLRRAHQRPPCGFIHEFIRWSGVEQPHPPFDFQGQIFPPDQCPLNHDNANCAHSNLLGLMLRAIMLSGKESEAFYYLKPFIDLLAQDGLFAFGVVAGESVYLMDGGGLTQQESSGREVMARVRDMIGILSFA